MVRLGGEDVRMRRADASRIDPSGYGLGNEDLDAVARTLATVGFHEVTVTRREGLDRQTMVAVVALR